MYSRMQTQPSTAPSWDRIAALKQALDQADAVVVGAGAGLSASAGLSYSGPRFERYFGDFQRKYGIQDMYTGGFFPFESLEEYWAWWSRHIWCNRYVDPPRPVYRQLLDLLRGRDYFVLTTNVDHQFQRAGFAKARLFYTQGDYGLWQCSRPCHAGTYDNQEAVRRMLDEQRDLKIPGDLVPRCPKCGRPMTMNLRADDTFLEDRGWHAAQARYQEFPRRHRGLRVLFWELGVGGNTPVIIKYPFWRMTRENPRAVYACINQGEAYVPREIQGQAIAIPADIGLVLAQLTAPTHSTSEAAL